MTNFSVDFTLYFTMWKSSSLDLAHQFLLREETSLLLIILSLKPTACVEDDRKIDCRGVPNNQLVHMY